MALDPEKKEKPANQRSSAAPKKHYEVFFFSDWCKSCGICQAFCPKGIIQADHMGKPFVATQSLCIGCRFCELHCPDFAIMVMTASPKQRKSNI